MLRITVPYAQYTQAQLWAIGVRAAAAAQLGGHRYPPLVYAVHTSPQGSDVSIEVILAAMHDEHATALASRLHGQLGGASDASARLGVTVLHDPSVTTGVVHIPAPPPPPPPRPPNPLPSGPPPPWLPPQPPSLPPASPPPTQPAPHEFVGVFAVLAIVMGTAFAILFAFLCSLAIRALYRGRFRPPAARVKWRHARKPGAAAAPEARRQPQPQSTQNQRSRTEPEERRRAQPEVELPTRPQPRAERSQRQPPAEAPPPSYSAPPPSPERMPPLEPHARLAQLAMEVGERLQHTLLQPPAWQLCLQSVYFELPPRALSRSQSDREAAALTNVVPMSSGVLRALRRALTHYHPDKNRAEQYGAEWAQLAEDVSKMLTELLEHYRRRIASTAALIDDHVDEAPPSSRWM